eukprot:TRINITY_DN24927_c0_g1_i2.p1 TRINITY_DN24927_c0_g1~~TRINITY_DN24927_c0_g1_i2.p1  ORF type:complete len:1441 (-),score=280.08 TRINITY_DN24927_c0_g1_i2:63-4076(-)
MPLKAYILQGSLWVTSPLLGVLVVLGLAGQPAWLRFVVGGGVGLLFTIAVDVGRSVFTRRVHEASETRKVAWFADYDDIDFSTLFAPRVLELLFPEKKSRAHQCVCLLLSFSLAGTAVGVLEPRSLQAQMASGSTSSWIVSLLGFLAVATAQFGLIAHPAVEVTAHRYLDQGSMTTLLVDASRPLLLLSLLLPLFVELPGSLGLLLPLIVVTLPALWALGLVPQLDALSAWVFDQVEVHFFGGPPAPLEVRLLLGVLASSAATAGVSLAAVSAAWQEPSPEAVAVVVSLGLALSGCLASMPPHLTDVRRELLWRLGAALAQAFAAAGVGIALLCSLGIPAVLASLDPAEREFDAAWLARISLEQAAVVLSVASMYAWAARRLRVDAGATGCLSNRSRYRAGRSVLLWGEKGPRSVPRCSANRSWFVASDISGDNRSGDKLSEEPPSVGSDVPAAATRIALVYSLLEALVRVLVLAHVAIFGVLPLIGQGHITLDFMLRFALLLRAWRVAIVDPPRAAVDAWVVGIVDLVLVHTQAISSGFVSWPLPVQLMVVSVARQRLALLAAFMQYSFHLSWVTTSVPKLRHPITHKVLWTNALLFPGLLLVLLLAAALESPLVALFTMPLFIVGHPRARHGHLELAAHGQPVVKGTEGIFYSSLVPSLLRGLAVRWRCRALNTRPGTTLLCRSHERLACVVRVLSAGFGWVQVEVRGLEMQEPTSCHHVEAGKIDDAFAAAFTGVERERRSGFESDLQEHDSLPATGGVQQRLDSFVLRPVCEVTALGYEQTSISLRGIIDNPETLRQVHRLFLKTLVYVFLQAGHESSIPSSWLSCPLQHRDAQVVMDLIQACSWPSHLFAKLSTRASGQEHATPPGAVGHGVEGRADGPYPAAVDPGAGPAPPPGNPPTAAQVRPRPQSASTRPRSGRPQSGRRRESAKERSARSPEPNASVLSESTAVPSDKAVSPDTSTVDIPDEETDIDEESVQDDDDDLDALMDMVLGMAPSTATKTRPHSGVRRSRPDSASSVASSTDATKSHSRPHSGLRRARPASASSSQSSAASSNDTMKKALDVVQEEEEPKAKQVPLKPPKHLAPLNLDDRPHLRQQSTPTAESTCPKASAARRDKAQSVDETDGLCKLLVQVYAALNVAPLFGQPPEALGADHVARLFIGDLKKAAQVPELKWLQEQPELLHLSLKAFRYALKVVVDAVVMGEDASVLEYWELEAALKELDQDWFLGQEGSHAWEAAMKKHVPKMMAVRKKGLSEVQVIRLCHLEDGVRVGELRSEVVQSIWASASLELSYLANDDDERYSIQAHPTLFRNMVVQCAEYPIYVSPPTTVWL